MFLILTFRIDDVNATIFKSGAALYGIIKMVKYDKIPKHFQHRYLLSDFGLVDLDPLTGNFVDITQNYKTF